MLSTNNKHEGLRKMEKKQTIALDLDIFVHLMTSAYREGFRAGADKNAQTLEAKCAEAAMQFAEGMKDMLKEPQSAVQH